MIEPKDVPCPECSGTGVDEDMSDGKCPECVNGRLSVEYLRESYPGHIVEAVIQRERERINK